ncbi:2-keto-3-deoxygluconate permease KdgT [Clostridium aceticum]|uniref:2-keto-3-deoxygluconate permease KdgT n=1 Tax=Clostridium aceticum TaxID=84022 RepID=A0A0D8IC33_9CLOT|nr:2-keto-3-deoxygluconate permease [Clostridium aceticum]AKL94940.1 2-keto-3-deoxygluconate permease KdgT [Clostridium aceticum]KJF27855.1 2-keto-3-deoxygluconate permease [Clostridium aceticum]
MIMKFLKKVPAGMMIVPMLIASLINTFVPQIVQIGSFTTAVFTSAGAATAIGIQLFCLGTTLQFKEMPKVFKRGGILLLSKFIIGATIGIAIGKIFGMAGILGLTTLSIISAVTNSNGSVYLSLMNTYGDETDCAAMALLALNDGPFFTLVALGASGLANIPLISLLAAVVPIIVGMILGNIDKDLKDFLAPAGTILIPFVGFALGAGINITNIVKGGPQGILLGVICTFVGGIFILACDRFIGGRPGYAAWAVSTTAGNAVAVPAAVALIDPAWQPYVATATTQVAAATVMTAILVPFITDWWARKYGCPKIPLGDQKSAT